MTARNIPLVFDCPRWPACGCPDGTIADDCPGVSRPALDGLPQTAAAPPAAADSATGGLPSVASSPAGVSSPPAGDFLNAKYDPFLLRLETVAASCTPEQAIRTLWMHAGRLGITCIADINGTSVMAFPREAISKVFARFNLARLGQSQHK